MQRRQFLVATGGMLAMAAAPKLVSAPVQSQLDAAGFASARRFVQTRFGRIAVVERGSGEAALFLHGFPLNAFQWRGAIERLSAYRRCIAPDFLGLGYTQPAQGQGMTPSDQVAMLVALLDQLQVERADVVANDSGGAVAQLLLVRHPQRVRSVLLTNCDTEIDCPPPAMQPVLEMARNGEYVRQWLTPWLADKALARSANGLGGMTFTRPDNPSDEAIEIYLGPLVRNAASTEAYALGLDGNVLAGIEAGLKRSTAPVRVLWGTGDTIFKLESAAYLERTLGNSRGVRYLEGAKLFFPEEFPDIVAEEARRLWGIAQ